MFDRETRSLWSQFLSTAVKGEFAGTDLQIVPLTFTTWEQWVANYPDTVALRKSSSSARDVYDGYYAGNDAGVIGEKNPDPRLPRKELVLGVGFDDGPRAFPHSELRQSRVVNDSVAGVDTLVFFETRSNTALAFDRVIDGQTLTFQLVREGREEFLVDEETGTKWAPFTGQAIEGELAGKILRRQHAVNVFWFAWTDFYPNTSLFGL